MAEMTLEFASARREIVGQAFHDDNMDGFSIFETTFRECTFKNCIFDGGKVGMSSFSNCRFIECSFKDASLLSCEFSTSGDQPCMWTRCDLSHAAFRDCDLSRAKFVGCRGFMLHLEGCNLSGAQIDLDCQRHVSSRLIHGGIKAVKSNFYDAKLTDLDLQGSKFEFCDLRAADLARSNFSYAVFAGSNLNGTRIKGASLASANIGHADIEELDLGDAMTIDDLTISVDQRDRVLRHFMINVISA